MTGIAVAILSVCILLMGAMYHRNRRAVAHRLENVERTNFQQSATIQRIEKKMRIGRKPERYDQIERRRKRRKKQR